MIKDILTYPDRLLSRRTRQVDNIDDELQQFIDDMIETMLQAPGIGLAATQVGEDRRIIVYNETPHEDRQALKVLMNPVIVAAEGTRISENEGCLSVPDFRADVKRHSAVVVEGVDRHGTPVHIENDEFLAVLLQHEIDHLEGILFIDRISKLKKELYRRRVKKQMKKE